MKDRQIDIEMLNELEDVLRKEIDLHRRLLSVTREETGLIVNNEVESLLEKTRQMESLVVELRKLEKQRMCLADGLRESLGMEGDPTLSAITEAVEEPHRSVFAKQFEEINELLQELRSVNRSNAMLIRQSLEYIDFNIKLLAGASDEPMTYEPEGKRREGAVSGMLDQRA